jgi:hypothetical protein
MNLSELLEQGLIESEVKLYLLVWLVVHGYANTPNDEIFKKYLDLYPMYKVDERMLSYEDLEFMKHYEVYVEMKLHLKKGEKE